MKHFNFKQTDTFGFAFALMLGTVLTLNSCTSSEEVSTSDDALQVPVTIQVSNFAMTMEDMLSVTRSETAADYTDVKAITMAFSPVITRLYGPDAFGMLGTFTATLAVVTPSAALTYPIAIVFNIFHNSISLPF